MRLISWTLQSGSEQYLSSKGLAYCSDKIILAITPLSIRCFEVKGLNICSIISPQITNKICKTV